MFREYRLKKIYQGSLKKGVDIIGGLTQIIRQSAITAGVITGIGAVGWMNSLAPL